MYASYKHLQDALVARWGFCNWQTKVAWDHQQEVINVLRANLAVARSVRYPSFAVRTTLTYSYDACRYLTVADGPAIEYHREVLRSKTTFISADGSHTVVRERYFYRDEVVWC